MFLKNPLLPRRKVKFVLASPNIYPEALQSLQNMGITVIFTCKLKNVLKPISYHADMQIVHLGDDVFVCEPSCADYYQTAMKSLSAQILPGYTNLTCNYPGDIAYNIIVTESVAVHTLKHTDSRIKSMLCGKKCIDVKQGYTACSLCPVSQDAFLTADEGITTALQKEGFDVLCVRPGFVALNGFDYGFIGGACGLISDSILAFNGKIENHPDYSRIFEFCQKHSVSLLSLSDRQIMDIGSVIPLCE